MAVVVVMVNRKCGTVFEINFQFFRIRHKTGFRKNKL